MNDPVEWTPVSKGRNGEIFCSPRCGFSCSRAAHIQARKEAIELCTKLGPLWTPNIWENCGWNYQAALGICCIQPMRLGSAIAGGWRVEGFRAWINTNPQFISETQKTPQAAFREALTKMQCLFEELQECLREFSQIEFAGELIESRHD